MRISCLIALMVLSFTGSAQTPKRDTIKGVVVYTGYSDVRYIAKGNYHTYTVEGTAIRTDTGIISILTEFGYIDLRKNYDFIPLNKLQPAHLKSKP